ncbi:MAG TPA: alpha/beta hydrolase [Actinocrinis sp.]|jgi:sigma-B regulation protein RsbQ
MLAHGFGCDQNLWLLVVPALAGRFRVVLFDYVGCGHSDPAAWDRQRYASLGRTTRSDTTCSRACRGRT